MNIVRLTIGALLISASCMAQTIVGMTAGGLGTTLNQSIVGGRPNPKPRATSSGAHPDVVVFTGDTVFAQLVDGASWKTAFYFVNLESHSTTFEVLFFNDDGTDMFLPIIGLGTVRRVAVTLNPAGSIEFESPGVAANLAQGWAYIVQTGSSVGDSVGSSAVFRQTVPGFQAQEAVVPVVNQFEDHFVLMYDNTAYVTAIAIANPTLNSVIIPVNIRNGLGTIIDQRTIALGPYQHTAFVVPILWPSTAGQSARLSFSRPALASERSASGSMAKRSRPLACLRITTGSSSRCYWHRLIPTARTSVTAGL